MSLSIDVAERIAVYLSPQAKELWGLLGAQRFCDLINARGGVPVYIPKMALGSSALAQIIGAEGEQILINFYGVGHLMVPNAKMAIQHARREAMLAAPGSRTQVALKYGVTERQVRRLNSKWKGRNAQPDLFGEPNE